MFRYMIEYSKYCFKNMQVTKFNVYNLEIEVVSENWAVEFTPKMSSLNDFANTYVHTRYQK